MNEPTEKRMEISEKKTREVNYADSFVQSLVRKITELYDSNNTLNKVGDTGTT